MSFTSDTILVALELSNTLWLVGTRLPGIRKSHIYRIDAGDTDALLKLLGELQSRNQKTSKTGASIACCFEAGRDGFWIHRLLTDHNIPTHVVEPTSILVNRRAKRAKTDRLDVEGLLRVLAAYLAGDTQICSMVRVPTPDEEDGKRVHREREYLVQERTRIENRILALLATQGIRSRPSLRTWERDIAVLETGDGRKLPRHLTAELNRLRRRFCLVRELITELDAERDELLATTPPSDIVAPKVAALAGIYGVGSNFAAVLAREVFYRQFGNRKQLASYVGLTPIPHQSGSVDKDRRIGRAGNARVRKTMVQAAWLWLRYQPDSELSAWFRQRVGALKGRARRIAIVAMARKLLIALWRFTETGEIPAGAILRTA
ncbi:IS110 family transposase [Labrys neptuniae]|uniref:IS110 family transposase n=1 Tax=Labrys neptuniae TaxID=376174 RepID=A0ABV3PYE0_9HYPH